MSSRCFLHGSARLLSVGLALAAFGPAAPAVAPPDQSAWLVGGYDITGILRGHKLQGGFLQWRGRPVWQGLRPWAGASVGSGGPYFLGAGALYGLDLTPGWQIAAMFGPGFFDGRDRFVLGSELEFLSVAEISRRLPWGHRLGVGFGHISNGGVSRVNPGSEFIEVGYHIPLPWRRRPAPH